MAVFATTVPLRMRRVVIDKLVPEFKQGKIRQAFEGDITFFPKEKNVKYSRETNFISQIQVPMENLIQPDACTVQM